VPHAGKLLEKDQQRLAVARREIACIIGAVFLRHRGRPQRTYRVESRVLHCSNAL
jgi:hypothetical protein